MAQGKAKLFILAVVTAWLSVACTSYRSQEVPFRLPSAYQNMHLIAGAQVAAEAYNKQQARQAFGFNIHKTGIQPVQVIIDNQGSHALRIVPEQTFLMDAQGNLWNLLDSRTANERVTQSTEYARIAEDAGRGSLFGAAGGALVGAAIGVLTGENVGTATAKGVAVGGAGGAILGGAEEGASETSQRNIARDLGQKQLHNQAIAPAQLGRGFLFFPGEAGAASQLRLQIKDTDSGQIHTRTFPLQ